MERKRLVVLGATGTVGKRALEIAAQTPERFELVGLSAHQDSAGLANALPGTPTYLTHDPEQAAALLALLRSDHCDLVLHGIVGAAGLPYALAAAESGKQLALANKESLVMAGPLLAAAAAQSGAKILPVDSEHSAIHQCLASRPAASVRRILLTGSGGALRDVPLLELPLSTPEQALAHPNWSMGPRITVDSATMMNKVFEILEAGALFGIEAARISVLIHRQSVVHSMVEFEDGSVLAQVGPPDMGFPIHYALHAPEVVASPLQGFQPDLFQDWSFRSPDPARYPALALAAEAEAAGGAAGAILNAADEVAVGAFLEGRLPITGIAPLCQAVLRDAPPLPTSDLDEILAIDRWSRAKAEALLPLVDPA